MIDWQAKAFEALKVAEKLRRQRDALRDALKPIVAMKQYHMLTLTSDDDGTGEKNFKAAVAALEMCEKDL
jgi:hypothetical protein